ncbi:MAG: hypothetical protein JNK87_24475, partial [Bryobacterales bacterium]|nr:hypothetical protein [Bryobacterales bacterium]
MESRDALAAEGLTVELIRQLGTVPGLTVLAPMSTLAAGGSQDGALQMGANAILDCRLEGTKLQASLSRVEGDRLLSVGRFDNVIQPAVEALKQFVAAKTGARMGRGNVARAALDLATYQLYLAGRAWFHRWSPDNLVQAQGCFEEVLARNSGFAPAWAGLADIQVLRAYWHAAVPRPVLEQGLVYAQRAADLDPGCGDSYCSLAAVTAALGRDWEKAEMLFRLAIESNHSNALAL